jgi:hypothetical protein
MQGPFRSPGRAAGEVEEGGGFEIGRPDGTLRAGQCHELVVVACVRLSFANDKDMLQGRQGVAEVSGFRGRPAGEVDKMVEVTCWSPFLSWNQQREFIGVVSVPHSVGPGPHSQAKTLPRRGGDGIAQGNALGTRGTGMGNTPIPDCARLPFRSGIRQNSGHGGPEFWRIPVMGAGILANSATVHGKCPYHGGDSLCSTTATAMYDLGNRERRRG